MAKKKKSDSKRRRPIDFGEAKKKQKEMSDRSGNEYHELKEGWNHFYICQPWSDETKVPWKEVQQHGLGLVCPKHSGYGKDCYICKERRKRLKKGDTDFADNFRLASRGFFNAIRKENIKEKDPANVKILGVSGGVLEQIVDHVTDERVDICDPEAAVIVAIKRKGKGFRTRYPSVKFGEAINIDKYITDDVLAALWDLDTIRSVQPASSKAQQEAIRKFARGGADEDDDDSFEDEEDFDSEELEGEVEEDEIFEEPDDADEDSDEEEEDLDADLDDEDEEEDLSDDEEEEDEEEEEQPRKKKDKVRKADKKGRSKKRK